VTRWGTYYSKTYKTWKAEAEEFLSDYSVPDLFTAPVLAAVSVVVKRPKKLTREYPRPDVDNFAKAALDALTVAECVWKDDDQVVKLIVQKRYAELDEAPHTHIHIEEY
jgi:Holliday junction resolvase RusA-like endonuclease